MFNDFGLPRSRARATTLGVVVVVVAALGGGQASAATSTARTALAPPFYTLKNAKAKCRAHYTKQTVTIRVRRHHRSVRVHQVRCVHTGAGSSSGVAPVFPINLPTAAVSVIVIPGATDNSYSTAAGQTLNVGGAGVLANDAGSGLSAVLVSGPAHGALTLNRNGSFRYTPASGASGVEHFTYKDTDSFGDSSTPATVTIHVTPVLGALGAYNVSSAGTLSIAAPGVLGAAVGSGLQASLVSGVSGGSLTLNADGSFSYTAAPGFSGSDSFTFAAVDGASQASNNVTVTIVVGPSSVVLQPPALVPHTFAGAVGNTELQIGGTRGSGPEVFQGGTSLLAGDSDPNGGTLSVTPANNLATAQGGSVTLAADGTFVYQPPAGYAGSPDSFDYQVNTSEGTSAPASATIGFSGARVWYVNGAAVPGGTGTSAAPFNSLAGVSGTAAGDVLFLFGGSYTGGVVLGANQTLVGQSVGLTVNSVDLLDPSGGNPVITNAGVTLANGDSVSGVSVASTSGAGISATGAFTIDHTVSITNAGGDGLDVNGGNANAVVAAQISGSTGHSVFVQNRSGGTLTLSGAITDTGAGVLVSNDTGATINFTRQIVASTGAQPAFTATGGGTVSATWPSSTLATTTATALDVAGGTLIGSGGLTFQSISAGTGSAGPVDGVLIAHTGTGGGGLTVLGIGSAPGSGGTIQHTTGAGVLDGGVSVTDSGPLTLTDMAFSANAGAGVNASIVPLLKVTESSVSGSGAAGIVGSGDGSVAQTVEVIHNTLTGQHGSAISLSYTGATNGYVDNNTIGASGTANSGSAVGDGIDLSSTGGTLVAEVLQNTIHEIGQGTGIVTQTVGSGVLDLTLSNNTVTMDSTSSQNGVTIASGNGGNGTVCVNPTTNSVTAAASGTDGMQVEALAPTSVFELQGYGGAASDTAAVASFLEANNGLTGGGVLPGPVGPGALATQSGGNTTGFTSATCGTPPTLSVNT